MDIEKKHIETRNPGLCEEEEFHTLEQINVIDAKLTKLDQ